ncbi:hypothetical protein NCER_101594 [Vairimorpha ceranae BRL01]|uniref:HSF-type DNA-binding domain-containing protein n=1 Tax=Vairimorpha ceranae (strain BRL01) TaxID=578460 RepID=C4VAD2_VAIC1|nr:hypothetical protein NCER_101594 [Vairimorpha ceranae BRL01]
MKFKESKEFVKKLYDILEDKKNEKYIRWNESGLSFFIIDPKEFAENILQNFFRHKNINSFIRQLNKYDFHKIKSKPELILSFGNQVIEFEHMYFQRGKRNQLYKIKRKSSSLEQISVVSDLLPGVKSNQIFHEHIIVSIKDLSNKFDILIDNVNDIKKMLNNILNNTNYNFSVLIYDEDTSMAMQIYNLLKDKRLNVTVMESKSNLYSALKNIEFNFMIFGANLLFFKEVMRYLRGFNHMTPVIYIGFEKYDFDLYSIGVTDFIKKPFTFSDFFNVINKYIPKKENN